MSTNSNFRKNKCWSCEFYSCKREYKKGIFFGDSVNCDNSGICSNKRSFNYYNKTVFAIAFIGIPLFLYLFTYLSILFDI